MASSKRRVLSLTTLIASDIVVIIELIKYAEGVNGYVHANSSTKAQKGCIFETPESESNSLQDRTKLFFSLFGEKLEKR
jgi:hypothetical protein